MPPAVVHIRSWTVRRSMLARPRSAASCNGFNDKNPSGRIWPIAPSRSRQIHRR
jgi:hypothetical protein